MFQAVTLEHCSTTDTAYIDHVVYGLTSRSRMLHPEKEFRFCGEAGSADDAVREGANTTTDEWLKRTAERVHGFVLFTKPTAWTDGHRSCASRGESILIDHVVLYEHCTEHNIWYSLPH